jgi:hypothetical protein
MSDDEFAASSDMVRDVIYNSRNTYGHVSPAIGRAFAYSLWDELIFYQCTSSP